MTIDTGILIWLIPLIIILIAVFILWIVTTWIRASKVNEMTEEDVEQDVEKHDRVKKNKKKNKKKKI